MATVFLCGMGVIGPANIPADVVNTLNMELREVLNSEKVRTQLAEWGVIPIGSTPDEFSSFIQDEREKWAAAIKAGNVSIE